MSSKIFQFGKNWQGYLVGHYSDQALERSMESLKSFLPFSLSGKTFVDVGCGSGIHSLAALKFGAKRVMSFDADPNSVEAAEQLKAVAAPNSAWEIGSGSLLDTAYMRGLGQFDVVYCWGVAHHTGDMWKALGNLEPLVAPGGVLFVAIYNTVDGRGGSAWWLRVKSFYNDLPPVGRSVFGWLYTAFNFVKLILHGKDPFRVMREYERKRGMSWRVDLIDWLGGYPYEHAKPEEVFSFFKEKYALELVKMKTTRYIGCNQFVFVRKEEN